MSIKEYDPAAAFPGVIGRTIDESKPAWPRPLRAKPGAPNVLFIVLDDTGYGQLGCYGSPIRTPNLDRLAANGLRFNNMHTTALCSPSRSCILTGPQPPLERDGVHHRGRDRLPGLERPHPLRATASSPRSSSCTATTRSRSASGTSRPPSSAAPRAPTIAGRSGAASSASTASWAATPTSTTRTSSTTTTRSRRRATPEEGYHLTEDLVDHADRVHRRRQAGRARQAVLHLLLHRRDARAAPGAARVDRQVQGHVRRRLGRLPREGLRKQLELGLLPPGTKLSGARSRRAGLEEPRRRREAALRAHDGGLRRLPRAHRPPDRPAARLPREDRPARQHAS